MKIALLIVALHAPLAAQPDRFGLPSCSNPGQELATRAAHIVCHSAAWKIPVWTAYELTPGRLAPTTARHRHHFRHDFRLNGQSAYDTDYRNTGYSRGHMVPAGDQSWSEEAEADTYLLSNAVPQDPSLNSGRWRQLENAVRRLAAASDSVIVLTGPILCETAEHIGPHHIAVPCELFKVVVAVKASRLTTLAAILPNGPNPTQPLAAFLTSIDEVERRTGLDFFPQVRESHRF